MFNIQISYEGIRNTELIDKNSSDWTYNSSTDWTSVSNKSEKWYHFYEDIKHISSIFYVKTVD